ncbi:MAG: hypothetical protein JXA66_05415, partial [Oligoflexia bacterium]|nr:hypothetical protein [Oligoflexia bacterium]
MKRIKIFFLDLIAAVKKVRAGKIKNFLKPVHGFRFNFRDMFRKKGTQKGVNSIVTAVLVFFLIIFVNYIASNHQLKKDFTSGKVNSLSDQSIKVLGKLEDKITFLAFASQVGEGQYFRSYMEKFRYYNKNIE